MTVHDLLNWRVVNDAIPFIGLITCSYLLFSKETCTRRVGVSTAVVLATMFWLILTWADWGSIIFSPSYPTMLGRALLLIVSLIMANELHHYTRVNRVLGNRNKQLAQDNFNLRCQNQHLQNQLREKKHARNFNKT